MYVQQPLPNANPKVYYKFHQTIGHDTNICTRQRHEIQDLIDAGKITDLKARKPNTQNSNLPNYKNAPPPDASVLMIGTGLTEKQVFYSFVDVIPESTGAETESLPQTK